MLRDTALIIGIPFVFGIVISQRFPAFAAVAQPWVRRISLFALLAFILGGLAGNAPIFIDNIGLVFVAVLLQGLLALLLGYSIASWAGLQERNRIAVTFEVGVRNAGLGLGMVFTFFGGIGGMAMVAGWWGIWDIITGLVLATWWAHRGFAAGPVTT
jgi:BASS family bile acid:Na+ symporter